MRWVLWGIGQLRRGGLSAWALARRWPGAALIAAVVVVLVLPLIHDLYYAIPWCLRKGAGRVLFIGMVAVGFGRLWRVCPGDVGAPAGEGRGAWWEGWVAPLVGAALAVPFLRNPGYAAWGDWDLNLQKYESVRRTILEWGQFPWWDPWCRGGFPLAANPQCGVVGVATPLVLAFGTTLGMRLATLACLLIATEGARRLARYWLGDPAAAVAAGLIYGVNGGVLVQVMAGYHLPMSYCAFPWMVYHTTRLGRGRTEGVLLGAWLAFNVLNGINYFSVYAAMVCAVVWLRTARLEPGPSRVRFAAHTALALGILLALAGWRLATTGLVFRDFPRPYTSGWDETPWSILTHLLNRPTAAMTEYRGSYFWETTCYVGPVALALAAASLARGWRWWHTLAAVCGWLAAGSVAWYHPSYWLADLPVFSAMHVVTRWRIIALLGLALAAADALARLGRGGSRARRALAAVLVAAVAADYVQLGYRFLPLAFRLAPDESIYPGPPVPTVTQVAHGLGFPAVHRGYGLIPMQEPLLGYDQRDVTARLWRGHPGYVAEHWSDAGPVQPRSWSPNRITFRVAPGQTVYINQNPGSWWAVGGHAAFPDWRCAETRRVFAARADERGTLVVEIRPRGLGLGLALHLAGVALVGVALAFTAARASVRADFSDFPVGPRRQPQLGEGRTHQGGPVDDHPSSASDLPPHHPQPLHPG
jgi:hypothetical protein